MDIVNRFLPRSLNRSKNVRLFKSDFLEKLSMVHPLTPHAVWIPISVFLFQADFWAWSIAGLLFWSIAEYILHRFVFHYEATTDFGKRIAYLMHGIHHDDPNDEYRLVMPPVAGMIIAAILYSIFYLFLGAGRTPTFFSGFLIGYLIYDTIHFSVHAFRPSPNSWFGKLKNHHMKHHFVTQNKRYGVSSPLWDWVFRSL